MCSVVSSLKSASQTLKVTHGSKRLSGLVQSRGGQTSSAKDQRLNVFGFVGPHRLGRTCSALPPWHESGHG